MDETTEVGAMPKHAIRDLLEGRHFPPVSGLVIGGDNGTVDVHNTIAGARDVMLFVASFCDRQGDAFAPGLARIADLVVDALNACADATESASAEAVA